MSPGERFGAGVARVLARAFGKERQNPYTIGAFKTRGPLAQLVEQRTFNPWVVGSIPTGPTFVISRDIVDTLRRRVRALF